MEAQVITEGNLPAFRSEQFAPEHVLGRLPGAESVLLFNEPPGIGKTTLGRMLISAALDNDHDLVIFIAPTRAILTELICQPDTTVQNDQIVVLERRPSTECGALNGEWRQLEAASCAALGKDQLCRSCPRFNQCRWPDQIERIDQNTRLVLLTEQYLILNPGMIPSLIRRVAAVKPLVILDEALFLTQSQVHIITRRELETFAKTLGSVVVDHPLGATAVEWWRENLEFMLDRRVAVDHQPRFFPGGLEHATLAVQAHGISSFGSDYKHLAHDLTLLHSKVTTGQWQQDGSFEIAVRVDLGNAQTVVLAPYMEADLVAERLQREVVVANPGFLFRHSRTRVTNIRDGIGSARSMGDAAHRKRVIDTFAAMVLRNALHGKRTVLVAKKRFLTQIAQEIETFAQHAELPLRVHIVDADARVDQFSARDIPLINFGIVGINALKDFDAIFAVGSYNITDAHLTGVYNQSLPPDQRHQFRIRTQNRLRGVESVNGGFSSRYHARRARSLHRTLERRVVLQAIGRARPFTSPTEVVLFQQDDFTSAFGEVEVFDTLGDLRSKLRLPTEAEVKRAVLGDKMRPHRRHGVSFRALASQFGVSVSTAHKALQSPSTTELLKGFYDDA